LKTIFVVDDNNVNLLAADEALSPHYRVFTLPSASSMFEILEDIIPDMILLDILMPEIDGFEALKRLKANNKADILGPSALASFRALTQGLLAAAHSVPYTTMGFSTSDAGNEPSFASFIFKSLDDITKRSKGKLFKHGKFSFFK